MTMTPSTLESRIQAIEATTLTPIVLKALQRDTVTLTDWTIEPVKVTAGVDAMGSSVVYRFAGQLQTQAESLPWSLILKVLSPTLVQTDQARHVVSDLEREFKFCQSDLPQKFPPGFRTATCYHLAEEQNEAGQVEYWLWLEDMVPKSIVPTREADYYQLAYALGCFNGRFLSQLPLPNAPWLRKNYIRDYLHQHEPQLELLFAHRDHSLVRRAFPPAIVDNYETLWRSREEHLATLDKLPQTLCHGDAQESNLFLTTNEAGQPEAVAIDWAAVGIASVGLDPAQLLWIANARLGFRSPNADQVQFSAQEQAIFAGYLAGLQAQGWTGDPHLARLGYTAALLRQRIGSTRSVSVLLAETIPPSLAKYLAAGMTLTDYADSLGQKTQFFNGLFQESLTLRDELL